MQMTLGDIVSESELLAFVSGPGLSSARTMEGWTPLHLAASEQWLDATRYLLSHGARPNVITTQGWSPLDLACESTGADGQIVVELLNAGATPHVMRGATSPEPGVTPLHRAARFGNLRSCEALLGAKAFVDARDAFGQTPLHKAKITSVIRLLHGAGADIDAVDCDGQTPITLAVKRDDPAAIRILLALGADTRGPFPGFFHAGKIVGEVLRQVLHP